MKRTNLEVREIRTVEIRSNMDLMMEIRGLCSWMLEKGDLYVAVSGEDWSNELIIHVEGDMVRLSRGEFDVVYDNASKRSYIAYAGKIMVDLVRTKWAHDNVIAKNLLNHTMIEKVRDLIVKVAVGVVMDSYLERKQKMEEEMLDSLK